jgi:adenosylhomocysteine nucleosidase
MDAGNGSNKEAGNEAAGMQERKHVEQTEWMQGGTVVNGAIVTGIIGAMEQEVERIRPELEGAETRVLAGIRFDTGTWNGKPVVLCRSGVGKVNAAVCTQMLIDRFGAGRILFTGVAGAADPDLDIGDLVISSECVQHDMDVRPLGYRLGEIPFAERSVFPADRALIDLAADISRGLFDCRVVVGRVMSGDQFIADKAKVKELREALGGACLEMEGAAVAQVCDMNAVPWVVIRSMSDKADGSAHVNFAEFAGMAAERSYRLVSAMVERLP